MARSAMNPVAFLTRRRGGKGWHWTDVVTFGWLALSLVMIFGPALWLLLSSFKTPAQLAEFPPTILPYAAQTATVETMPFAPHHLMTTMDVFLDAMTTRDDLALRVGGEVA